METKLKWPKISVVTPTLNSSRTIDKYFTSLKSQIYQGELEIIVLDGGSTDNTLKVAEQNDAKIYFNKLKTAEAGKALGVRKATGLICAFIDSDNILPNKLWLEKLVTPLVQDPEILVSEPVQFTYRRMDFWLTRYFALIGAGDPLNLFIGNYDKYSFVTNKWTNLKLSQERKTDYLKIKIEDKVPTIGANGSLFRKNIFDKYPPGSYLFDVDILEYMVRKNPIYIAKVDESIVHLFSGDISTFIRKQRRRIRDYLFHKNTNRRINSVNMNFIYWGIFKFVISCLFIFPLFFQMIIGFLRKRDLAWVFHPFACYITLFAYGYETVRSVFIKEEYNREGWKQ